MWRTPMRWGLLDMRRILLRSTPTFNPILFALFTQAHAWAGTAEQGTASLAPGQFLLFQVLFVLAQLLMWGGLVALLVLLARALVRRIRGKPQGRLRRGIVVSAAMFLVGASAFAVMLHWMLTRPFEEALAKRDWANQPGTLTQIGQPAPDFEITTVDGSRAKLTDLRGKVIALSFFAVSCGPCRLELPRLEQEIWQVFRDQSLAMLVIGREETEEAVNSFRREHGFTFPMAADQERSVYAKFAEKGIPRTYVVDGNGTIVYQCTGYYEPELQKMKAVIREHLRDVRRSAAGHPAADATARDERR